ncbi:MAG: HTTM domain-containing protein [Flavobacteriaceae bacterium]|nr:HTTM domain-containing protein [Flavobacteriaceae bacterium]
MNTSNYLEKKYSSAPLAVFRIGFGLLMCFSIIRFWFKGWIETLYIEPSFHFSYYGFEWVKPLGHYTYVLFIICGISAFLVAVGLKYRLSIFLFFLSFTYIELMDKTTYLNHYYLISILSFLMIFLPANASFSIDNLIKKRSYLQVPKWTIDSIKILLTIVYFYSGLAKINSDWLFKAMPLKIWLPSKFDIPLIGENLMQLEWVHYLMSWGGMFYDLLIPFLLLYKPTRIYAFLLVIFFHLFTKVLFPIGMFPYIMIMGSLIFFDSSFHLKVISLLKKIIPINFIKSNHYKIVEIYRLKKPKFIVSIISIFFIIQFLFPFRYLLYPGELFWNEQGYRFSWRVMLVEKVGSSVFKIANKKTGSFFYVNNDDFLTPFQEKQMSFQPDFILEYAHFLGDYYSSNEDQDVQVYVDSYVALNGRLSQRYVDKNVDLYNEKESFKHKKWILPLKDEIKGF